MATSNFLIAEDEGWGEEIDCKLAVRDLHNLQVILRASLKESAGDHSRLLVHDLIEKLASYHPPLILGSSGGLAERDES